MERLLRCDCGGQIVVTSAQAGSQITCSQCGTRLQVPTLRGLADLPASTAAPSASEVKALSQSVWRWRGPLMAICAGISLIAAIFAFFFISNWYGNWYSVDNLLTMDTHIAAMGESIQQSGPDELMQVWDDYTTVSLKFPESPPYKLLKDWAEKNLRNGQIALLICAAMSITFLVLWQSGKSAQRKQIREKTTS